MATLTFYPFLATRQNFPHPILRAAGLAGDVIAALTRRLFYITSAGCRSMVTDYVTPTDQTYSLLGEPTIFLAQGVQETLAWLHTNPNTPTPDPRRHMDKWKQVHTSSQPHATPRP